ncbi:unnamed protein product [Brachionus calyciflorus]|uniref:Uncharacterized protein n=1 Tax=Brachionus calyciflorus TaxID=104777 RepID=A0A814Q642_9BILA|nr:unnamed protein product [Brachionus calyciflorus]
MSKNPSPSVKLRNRTQTANNYIILSDTESDKENLENLQLKGTARLKTLSKKVKRKKDLVTTDSDDEPKKLSKKSKKTPFGETTENGHFSDPSDHEFPGNEPLIEDENFKIESKLTEEQYLEILNLFNNGTMDEFLALSNTPQKRLEFLFTLRPFEDYKDLQTRLYEHQYKLFLQSIEGIVYARGIVSIIFQRCIKISEKMEQKVSSLINMNDETTSRNQMEIKYQPQSLNKK